MTANQITKKAASTVSNNIVCRDNAIIHAAYSLTISECRIILLCNAKINSADHRKDYEFKITISEFAKQFNFSTEKVAGYELRKSIDTLYGRNIEIYEKTNSETKIPTIPWLIKKITYCSEINNVDETKAISVKFSQEIMPYLTDLKKGFTQYKISEVSNFSSVYAIRIYEQLIEKINKDRASDKIRDLDSNQREIYPIKLIIADLKEQFFGDKVKKYEAFGDFNSKVIAVAIKQINEHSNIQIGDGENKGYFGIKTHGITNAIVFQCIFKQKQAEITASIDSQVADFVNISNDQALTEANEITSAATLSFLSAISQLKEPQLVIDTKRKPSKIDTDQVSNETLREIGRKRLITGF